MSGQSVLDVMKRDADAFAQLHFLHQNRPQLCAVSDEARAKVEKLISDGNRLTSAFRTLSASNGVISNLECRRECESALLALDDALKAAQS